MNKCVMDIGAVNKKRKVIIEWIVYSVLLLLVFIVLYRVYSVLVLGLSDYQAHLDVVKALINGDKNSVEFQQIFLYPLYHFTVKIVAHFITRDYVCASVVVLSACAVITSIAYRVLILEMTGRDDLRDRIIIDVVSIFLVFFSTIPCILTDGQFYYGPGSANPWHNPTITAVRPFAVLSFCFFVRIIKNIIESKKTKQSGYIWLGTMMCLSVVAKPSWGLVFIPSIGLFASSYLLKEVRERLYDSFMMCLAVVPAGILMLFQLASHGDVMAETYKFKIGGLLSYSIPRILMASVATFPVCILAFIILFRQVEERLYVLITVIILLMGWVQYYMISNGPTGDMGWGYFLAIGVSTASFLALVMKKYWFKFQMWITLAVFTIQFIYGCQYLYLYYITDEYCR